MQNLGKIPLNSVGFRGRKSDFWEAKFARFWENSSKPSEVLKQKIGFFDSSKGPKFWENPGIFRAFLGFYPRINMK